MLTTRPGQSNEHWGPGVEIIAVVIRTKRNIETDMASCLVFNFCCNKKVIHFTSGSIVVSPWVITITLWKESRILTSLWFCHHVFIYLFCAKLNWLFCLINIRAATSKCPLAFMFSDQGFFVRLETWGIFEWLYKVAQNQQWHDRI